MGDRSPLKLIEDGQSSTESQNTDGRPVRPILDRIFNQDNENSNQQARIPQDREIRQRIRSSSPGAISDHSGQLKYGAKSVIDLFVPVSICIGIVIATLKLTNEYQYSARTAVWYGQLMFTDQSGDTVTRVWQAFANAFILLLIIVIMTTLLIMLYMYRFYKTIHAWLFMSSLMLLFLFTATYITVYLHAYNIPLDWVSLLILVWNIGAVGLCCIHWKGPLILQQGYLIMISALMALIFIKSVPDWTVWTILAIVSIWDLIAVLCPKGPLRMLVETAQKRNEPIFPALIYSSTMLWEFVITSSTTIATMAESERKSSNQDVASDQDSSHHVQRATTSGMALDNPNYDDQWPKIEVQVLKTGSRHHDSNAEGRTIDQRVRPTRRHSDCEEMSNEERGVKLGLGDFIFYSLLVGKVSSYGDWTITVSCYVAVLVGLCLTLSLLAVIRKALPALPISIAFGLSFYFLSSLFVVPFIAELSVSQIFI